MRIIISPAKKMRVDKDTFPVRTTPEFLDRALYLQSLLRTLDRDGLKRVWACSDKLLDKSSEFLSYDLERALTPALISYDGIQYQYMAPSVFTSSELDYLSSRLRIISGFYGVLRPFDKVAPYRLEMQANFPSKGGLYAYWKDLIYKSVIDESRVILNLASEEYAKAIRPYLKKDDIFIDFYFAELDGDKLVEKGVYAKIARGEMVRYLSCVKAEDLETIKSFNAAGYVFSKEHSSQRRFVFIR